MKSREGTVVDADDLIDDMYRTARETSLELGKLDGMDEQQQDRLFHMIGLGALKYFIIKVDPKKTMLFDPKESIDFNGNTGPFIQYTHARICSILRKADAQGIAFSADSLEGKTEYSPVETRIIKILSAFPGKISEAAAAHSPALVANYAYELAKLFNQLGEYLLIQYLPLIRIAIKLGYIDCKEIDKLFKFFFIRTQHSNIFFITSRLILRC